MGYNPTSQTLSWLTGMKSTLPSPATRALARTLLILPAQTDPSLVDIPGQVSDALDSKELGVDANGIVRWRQDSVTHPRRWPLLRKAYDSALICSLECFMTAISNTGSSIAPYAAPEFGISREIAILCFATTYLLGQALGTLVFPSVVESFGGRLIYVASTLGFAVLSVIMAAAPKLEVIIVGRFVTGAPAAMPATVACSNIENMWDVKARSWLIQIYIASAVGGLAIGPPLATYISTSSLNWPWVFYVAAIVTGAQTVLCIFIQESRPSQVLRQQVKDVSRETNFDGLSLDSEHHIPAFSTFVKDHLGLPLRFFFTEPIVFLVSIMAATVYGVIYLFAEAIPVVFSQNFGFSERHSSLVFFAILVGVAFTLLPRIYDIHAINQRRKQNADVEPEDKLFGFFVAAPVFAIGMWWFGGSVPPLVNNVSVWVSIGSLIPIGYGVVEFDNVLCGYLTDTYGSYAASANAPVSLLRAILSGAFPLFGRQMFENLGANYALFILGGVATGFCGVAVLFGRHGKRIRRRSPFAEKTLAVSSDVSDQEACSV